MYISYYATTEGIGAQYQRILGLLGICKVHNLKYIHNKITVGHNYNNDPEWDDKWDNFFNIKKFSDNHHILSKKMHIPFINIHDIPYISSTDNILYEIAYPFHITDINPSIYYNSIRQDCIDAYNESSENKTLHLFDIKKTNIAIHIRVFNDFDDEHEKNNFDNLQGRFGISVDEYTKLINKLKSEYLNTDIHIFTQHNIYNRYKAITEMKDIKLHIDSEAMESFHHMCKADVLVIAKSSFSYLAGLYNNNKVFYIPCQCENLNHWHNMLDYISS